MISRANKLQLQKLQVPLHHSFLANPAVCCVCVCVTMLLVTTPRNMRATYTARPNQICLVIVCFTFFYFSTHALQYAAHHAHHPSIHTPFTKQPVQANRCGVCSPTKDGALQRLCPQEERKRNWDERSAARGS